MRSLLMSGAAAMTFAAPAEGQGTPARSVSAAPPVMQEVAPPLAVYTDEVLFGEVWPGPGLSPRDRSLVTISALIAAGRTGQLTGHLGRALTNGVTPHEISGVLTHLAFYAGWPAAVSALPVAQEVFRERGVDLSTLTLEAEALPAPGSDADRAAEVERNVGRVAPGLARLTSGVLFGDLWRRPDLAPRDRSLATIAGLVATGDVEQLAFHVRLGIENGLTQEEIGEAVTHLAFYAGWPRAMAAARVLAEVASASASEQDAGRLAITRAGANAAPGPAAYFVGQVVVHTPFAGTGAARVGGATVHFEPGARTAWHTHPLGQTLIVTAGRGWVQQEGGPVEEIGPGDVAWIPPGVRHWHGATASEAMTHVAVAEAQGGSAVEWMEPVTDEQYRRHAP